MREVAVRGRAGADGSGPADRRWRPSPGCAAWRSSPATRWPLFPLSPSWSPWGRRGQEGGAPGTRSGCRRPRSTSSEAQAQVSYEAAEGDGCVDAKLDELLDRVKDDPPPVKSTLTLLELMGDEPEGGGVSAEALTSKLF